MLTKVIFIGIVVYFVSQRIRATQFSKRNAAVVLANGGQMHASNYLGVVKVMQLSWFLAMIAEVWLFNRPFIPALAICALILTVVSQTLRYLSMRELGDRWIHQVVTVPGTPVIESGVYKYIRHPNWCALIIELAVVPLIHTAYLTAIIFTLVNAWLLIQRIPAEEKALSEDTNYDAVFGNRPRFIPTISFNRKNNLQSS
ncbi:MAG TPA: isoprenylcysteine carboxylmethyltransferase family protein [Leptolyngbyaceae cyanobacterium]